MLETLILATANLRRLLRSRYLIFPTIAMILFLTCVEAVDAVEKTATLCGLAALCLAVSGVQMLQDERQGFHLAVRSMRIHISRLFISRFLSTLLLFLIGYIVRTVLLNIL
jgi:hypothetical protein